MEEGQTVAARLWFSYGEPRSGDLDNLRQAADWWLARDRLDLMVRLATATTNDFHWQARFDEPAEWMATALAREAELPRTLRSRCYTTLTAIAEMRGEFFAANEHARTAAALAEDPADAGPAYSFLVDNLVWIDPDEAERLLQSASEWAKALGPRVGHYIRSAQAMLAAARHDYDRAVALLSQVEFRHVARIGSFQHCAIHLLRGDVAAATAALEGSSLRTGSWFEYYPPFLRALIATVRGDHAAARAQLVEAVALVRRWKIPLGLADCVAGCAVVAFHTGDTVRASELLAAVQSATGGGLRTPISMLVFRHYRRAVRTALDRPTVTRARAAGAALRLEAALTRELGMSFQ